MEQKKIRVLFICTHNSARSQMAEALLKKIAGDRFEAVSAGIEPGDINPLAIEVMREIGIDISGKSRQNVFSVYKTGEMFSYVIAVCDQATSERCPIFPGVTRRLDWSFPDPSTFAGSEEEKLAKTRAVRDLIESKIKSFVESTYLPA